MSKKIKPSLPAIEIVDKNYILPPWRGRFVGIMLMLVGLCFTFMGVSFKDSLWQNFQNVFIDFSGWDMVLMSMLILPFKIGLIAGGYFYFAYAEGVVRARIDYKGFYYQAIPSGSRAGKVALDLTPLTFIAYHRIKNISYKKSAFIGSYLELETSEGKMNLTSLNVLRDSDKQDIVATIKPHLAADTSYRKKEIAS